MDEELGVHVAIDRLVWVVENFYAYRGRSHHELALLFLMTLPDGAHDVAPGKLFERIDEIGKRLEFCWFPVGSLDPLVIIPAFLKTAILSIPVTTEHVVHRGDFR